MHAQRRDMQRFGEDALFTIGFFEVGFRGIGGNVEEIVVFSEETGEEERQGTFCEGRTFL